MARLSVCLLAVFFFWGQAVAETQYRDYRSELPELEYLQRWFEQSDHDPRLPSPEALLGFPVGAKAATPAQIAQAVSRWAEVSERAEIVEYARSHEGRPLHYLVIASPANLARLAQIKHGMSQLADPRGLTDAQRGVLLDDLPAIAWLAYSIHGNESSGADAALAVIHHLLADRSETTSKLLDEVVVVIDPLMNPDGRQRFVQGVAQYRSQQPNVDDQSLVHTGYWPYGRGNHYLFDLNRDWIYGVHPETRGRIRAIRQWHPLLFVDAHEMSSQDSYLFSPARPPHNPHFPPYRYRLGADLADEMADAFDAYAYPFYSGEWADEWYPGYSDAWAALHGAQGILYEQARLADDGVQQLSKLISYPQGVHHQVIASMANLESLRQRRSEMLREFAEDRALVVDKNGPYGQQHYVLVPGDNPARTRLLLDLIDLQGFEVRQFSQATTLQAATDQLGRQQRRVEVPAGSLFLPGNQPAARALAAMFEFDPRIGAQALQKERVSLLATGETTFYDTTAWNISMMYGVEAYQIERAPDGVGLVPVSAAHTVPDVDLDQGLAFAVDGGSDYAPALAARLMQQQVKVRISDRASQFGGHELARGSVVVTADDNRRLEDWRQRLRTQARALGATLVRIDSARADTAPAPDLGGAHFLVGTPPRIGLVGKGATDIGDFGSLWFVLDRRLGVRHSHLDASALANTDLRRYNVIILPDGATEDLTAQTHQTLQTWVEAGGTLIASGASAQSLADVDWLATVTLSQVHEDPQPFTQSLLREYGAEQRVLRDSDEIWGRRLGEVSAQAPWASLAEPPASEQLHSEDDWQALFMPSGAMLAARVDQRHWLSAGSAASMPVYMGRGPVLHSRLPARAPVRLGVYDQTQDATLRRYGWVPVPAGEALLMRMSGLLWPEARQRLASAAWLTQESVGNGQVILFAQPPAFRGAAIGSIRLFENAVVYGPGLGARRPIALP